MILIVPIATFLLLLYQLPGLKEEGLNFKNLSYIFLGLVIMGYSFYDGCTRQEKEDDLKDTNAILTDSVASLHDSLKTVKDTLINIGLRIDEKTGRLLVMDSQLLKKEFKQILNSTYITNPPLPDERELSKDDFDVRRNGDILHISPKRGKWFNAYVAFDTSDGQEVVNQVEYAPGSSLDTRNIVPFNINGKIFITFVVKLMGTPVWSNSPIVIRSTQKNRYIIFGDEGISYKRYIYQSGKVNWVPE